MDKIVVTGCSISAHTKVSQNYCDFLSRSLNREPLTLAGGGGSNKRWHRLLIQNILDNTITKDDLIIMQMVEPLRTELHASHLSSMPSIQPKVEIVDVIKKRFKDFFEEDVQKQGNYHDLEDTQPWSHVTLKCFDDIVMRSNISERKYFYTNFKPNSWTYMNTEYDKHIHKHFEEYASVFALAHHDFYLDWLKLEAFLNARNMNYFVFVENTGHGIRGLIDIMHGVRLWETDKDFDLVDKWPYFKSHKWHLETNPYALDPPDDYSHYSLLGHQTIAKLLENHIIEQKILDLSK